MRFAPAQEGTANATMDRFVPTLVEASREAGYHVPENYVVRFDLNRLALSPQAETAGKYGRRIPLTRERLVDLIALVNPYPDGTIRALFSKIIPGRALGPAGLRAGRVAGSFVHLIDAD